MVICGAGAGLYLPPGYTTAAGALVSCDDVSPLAEAVAAIGAYANTGYAVSVEPQVALKSPLFLIVPVSSSAGFPACTSCVTGRYWAGGRWFDLPTAYAYAPAAAWFQVAITEYPPAARYPVYPGRFLLALFERPADRPAPTATPRPPAATAIPWPSVTPPMPTPTPTPAPMAAPVRTAVPTNTLAAPTATRPVFAGAVAPTPQPPGGAGISIAAAPLSEFVAAPRSDAKPVQMEGNAQLGGANTGLVPAPPGAAPAVDPAAGLIASAARPARPKIAPIAPPATSLLAIAGVVVFALLLLRRNARRDAARVDAERSEWRQENSFQDD